MIKRFLKYTLIFIVAIITCFYLYMRFGGYFFIEKEYRESIVREIEKAPELSDQFYELYELAYPNSLHKGVLSHSIDRSVFSNYNSECPILSIAYMLSSPDLYGLKIYMFAFYLQDQTTQKQCVNLETKKIDYLYNNIGIEKAAQFYFKKTLEDLDEKEMLTLIVMMKNPSLYNPLRRPEKIEERVNSILERRENTKKSRTLMQLFNIM